MPNTADQAAFKSTHPDVTAAWNDITASYDAWQAAMFQFRDQVAPGAGCLVVKFYGRRHVLAGFDRKPVVGPWRMNRAGDWIPDRRTGPGKRIGAEFDTHTVRLPALPGMPSAVLGAGKEFTHGTFSYDGTVWVLWGCDPATVTGVDDTMWAPARLSQYHAALEAAEAARETAETAR